MTTQLTPCPCCSQKNYSSCCEPFITEQQIPETPEQLMRSRYTAYAMAKIDYIRKTMREHALIGFQDEDAMRWAKKICWIKLHVLHTTQEDSNTGFVEFEALFIDHARLKSIHEKSQFSREKNRWYYVNGIHLPTRHAEIIINRNTICPCGSQRKFKNCHGAS